MNQSVISNFKAYYLRRTIKQVFEKNRRLMNHECKYKWAEKTALSKLEL